MTDQIHVSLPAPIANELWTKIDQAQGIINLAKIVAESQFCGELESSLASSLEVANDLLIDSRRLIDKLR
jgi:hypothetical protein